MRQDRGKYAQHSTSVLEGLGEYQVGNMGQMLRKILNLYNTFISEHIKVD